MDVFDLYAKVNLDTAEYEKGVKQAKGAMQELEKSSKFSLSSFTDAAKAIGKGAATAAKASITAIGAVGAALSKVVKSSLDNYAKLEQLEGGTKLMFGESADFIMQKSKEAYSTVQLSQNAYLEQVNGFAVGLKTALGGNEQAAAELADRIITAEADIVAATGTTQDAVQNAFNGIMKSNYTMLDNLQLGIKPTKEGMQEVIDKVNAWNAANGTATSYMIDNLADVQSALVDYVEMQGLAGYAANEAAGTISGSIASMKAAWSNFLSGSGSPAQVVSAFKQVAQNVGGKLKEIVPSLIDGISGLIDEIAPEVPAMMNSFVPVVVEGASSIIKSLSRSLPSIISTVLPSLVRGASDVVSALVADLPQILSSIGQTIPIVVNILKNEAPKMAAAAWNLIDNLVTGLFSEKSIDKLMDAMPAIIEHIGNGIGKAGKAILSLGSKVIQSIFNYFFGDNMSEHWEKILDIGEQLILTIWDGVKAVGSGVWDLFGNIVTWIVDELGLTEVWNIGAKMIDELWDGVKSEFDKYRHKFELIGEWIYNALHASTIGAEANRLIDQQLEDMGYDPAAVRAAAEQEEINRIRDENGFGQKSGGSLGRYEATPENYAKRFGVKNIPVFGNGGIVSKPTLAIVGDAGSEAIVPLDRDSEIGRRFGGSSFNITVYNDFHGVEDVKNVGNVVVQKIDEALRRYQVQQMRGQGGTAWS